jgi:glycosyltransferase involved in cell wall biosynthesis
VSGFLQLLIFSLLKWCIKIYGKFRLLAITAQKPRQVINKEMTSDIKVVISDNNSTDIEGYKNIEKYCTDNNVTYSRNATNLFSDTNIVSGFLHADKGNYLWILSDNDMLMEGSISKIMEILNHDIDVLFFTVKDRENIEFQNISSFLIFYKFLPLCC